MLTNLNDAFSLQLFGHQPPDHIFAFYCCTANIKTVYHKDDLLISLTDAVSNLVYSYILYILIFCKCLQNHHNPIFSSINSINASQEIINRLLLNLDMVALNKH